jgi:hypothetical protein
MIQHQDINEFLNYITNCKYCGNELKVVKKYNIGQLRKIYLDSENNSYLLLKANEIIKSDIAGNKISMFIEHNCGFTAWVHINKIENDLIFVIEKENYKFIYEKIIYRFVYEEGIQNIYMIDYTPHHEYCLPETHGSHYKKLEISPTIFPFPDLKEVVNKINMLKTFQ